MSDTKKIRYVGPLTEGLWIPAGVHGAHDFEHGAFVEVPVALAAELLERCEPSGDPVSVDGVFVTQMTHVWELEDGDSLPDSPNAPETAKPATRTRTRKGTSR